MTNPGNDGIPQHAAQQPRFWESPEFRTVVQGIAIDIVLALALVLYNATSGDSVEWGLLWLSLLKTAIMTLASSIMKRVKPRLAADAGPASR